MSSSNNAWLINFFDTGHNASAPVMVSGSGSGFSRCVMNVNVSKDKGKRSLASAMKSLSYVLFRQILIFNGLD